MNQMWEIMGDLIKGVKYIHKLKEVHRDLKPRNSNSSYPFRKLTLCSSLFCAGASLENCRLWTYV